MVFDWLVNSPPIKQNHKNEVNDIFEYIVWDCEESLAARDVESELTRLGRQGYELVSVAKNGKNAKKDFWTYRHYLKRVRSAS